MDVGCLNEVNEVLELCGLLSDHDATVLKSDSQVTYFVMGYVARKMLKKKRSVMTARHCFCQLAQNFHRKPQRRAAVPV